MANTVTISGTLYANGDTGEAAVCLKSLAWQRVSVFCILTHVLRFTNRCLTAGDQRHAVLQPPLMFPLRKSLLFMTF